MKRAISGNLAGSKYPDIAPHGVLKIKGLVLIILAYGVAAPQSVSADGCGAAFRSFGVDHGCGTLNQNHPRLRELGLRDDRARSRLCGPVSWINGLVKIRKILGLRSEHSSLSDEVAFFVQNVGATAGFSPSEIRNQGFQSAEEFAGLIEIHLGLLDVRAEVTVGTELGSSVQDHSVVIALIARSPSADPSQTFRHYSIIAGQDPNDSSKFLVIDPFEFGPQILAQVDSTLGLKYLRQGRTIDPGMVHRIESLITITVPVNRN